MHIRKLLLAAAAIAAICPAVSGAAPESAAVKACAHAFAASIAAPGTESPSFKLNYLGSQEAGALADYYQRQYTFFLKAHDAKTGLTLARATCSVDFNGKIVALTATPLEAAAPALAAQF
jgi:hypothetical protein